MAINMGNPAFRMALRRHQVLKVGAPAPPRRLHHKGETHIFVAERTEKTLNFFKQSFTLFTHLLTCLLFSTLAPRGSPTGEKSEMLHTACRAEGVNVH